MSLSSDGSEISPGTGVTILGAFYFKGGGWTGLCPTAGKIKITDCGDPCNP